MFSPQDSHNHNHSRNQRVGKRVRFASLPIIIIIDNDDNNDDYTSHKSTKKRRYRSRRQDKSSRSLSLIGVLLLSMLALYLGTNAQRLRNRLQQGHPVITTRRSLTTPIQQNTRNNRSLPSRSKVATTHERRSLSSSRDCCGSDPKEQSSRSTNRR